MALVWILVEISFVGGIEIISESGYDIMVKYSLSCWDMDIGVGHLLLVDIYVIFGRIILVVIMFVLLLKIIRFGIGLV